MRSATPKPLHPIGCLPMIGHTLRIAQSLVSDRICVVTSPDGQQVADYVRAQYPGAKLAIQQHPKGTGDAVLAAREFLAEGVVAIMFSDSPLTAADTLRSMAALLQSCDAAAALMGFRPKDAASYGMLQCGEDGFVEAIREGGGEGELANGGAMCVDGPVFLEALETVAPDGETGEIYLTAAVEALTRTDRRCRTIEVEEDEALGVNSRADLARAEAAFQRRARSQAMDSGVTLTDPETVYFSYDTRLDQDVAIGPHVVLGPGVHVESGARILPFCSLEGCHVEKEASVGPHARIRPVTRIGPRSRVGNFVEVKASDIGADVRIGHLTYVGDAEVGDGVNIGAGTVVCNYDGVSKHRTEIADGAFVGSNSSLVAPLRIGKNAYVGSGSVLTESVEEDALAISRSPQTARSGAARRLRERKGA